MTLSRRSFLKVAGLTAASVAAASMFTGCNNGNVLSTPVEYVAAEADAADADVKAAVAKMQASNLNFVPGHSDLYSGKKDPAKDVISSYMETELKKESYKDKVELKSVTMSQNSYGTYFLLAAIGKKSK